MLPLLLGAVLAGPAQAATFVVDTTNDGGDINLGDGICRQAGPPPRCSLRAALEEANAFAGADIINFGIGAVGSAQIITIGAPLLAATGITQPVVINGYTQGGGAYAGPPLIELSAAACGANAALDLRAGSTGSTIRGLAINRCPTRAIRIIGSNNHLIAGNHLGTNLAGTAALPNNTAIYINTGTGNVIGGTVAADRNIISGNSVDGVQIDGDAADGNLIQGNYIGLDVTGTVALGNGAQGVSIFNGADNNTVGGLVPAAANVISSNTNGVAINSAGTTGNLVQRNRIGTDWTGTLPRGNTQRGVTLDQGSSNNTVGGTALGAGNTIAFNGTEGVWMGGAATINNGVSSNAIFANGALGIDLNGDGVTANDTLDLDTGPNNRKNFPVLTAAMTNGVGNATFAGSVTGAASQTLRIEFFAGAAPDPSGYGEGQRYLGFANVTTDAAGNGVIGVTLASALTAGEVVSATAADLFGNTSEFSAARVAVGSLVVTTTSDTTTGSDTSSVAALIATPGADGRISLREAILAVNNTAGADTIRFGIPLTDANHFYYSNNAGAGFAAEITTALADVATPSSPAIPDFDPDYPAFLTPRSWYRIRPASTYAAITGPTVFDASTQPGYQAGGPVIEIVGDLYGTGPAARPFAVTVGTATSTFRGFVINRFAREAISSGATGTVVQGNYIGTDVSGTLARGNGTDGIGANVYLGGNNSQVGGLTLTERNILSAGGDWGLFLDASNIVVQGNYIGTDVTGNVALPNTRGGINLFGGNPTSNNTIGGTAPGARNVIAGNLRHGVNVKELGTVTNNTILGNHIGTNAAGTAALPNAQHGILVSLGSTGNVIGGIAAGSGNVISGNGQSGVVITGAGTNGNVVSKNRIGTDVTGTLDLGNAEYGVLVSGGASNNTIGATSPDGNVISGNNIHGVNLTGAGTTNNSVIGNIIGLDLPGTALVGNTTHGVEISAGASNNVVGGAGGNGNVISGNLTNGVNILQAGTSNNRVLGNIIGLDLGGTVDRGNLVGVAVGQGATANIIGQPGAGNGNVISGNDQYGVRIVDPGTNNNLVQSNAIGTDITGTLARGNTSDGVRLEAGGAATGNVIGGTLAGYGNLISGNGGSGIQVRDFMSATVIAGNTIGTNAAGNAAIPNLVHGVYLTAGTTNNTIGGTTVPERNLISGNGSGPGCQGVRIDIAGTTGNVVRGNFIGTNAAGTGGIPNTAGGIAITASAANNTIGGAAGNLIAYNTTYGVNVAGAAGNGNAILGNSIHSNTTLGIDLVNDGVTANDLGDGDAGPNGLQNFPVLSAAMTNGAQATFAGSLNSTASTTFRIEFFASSAAQVDPTGFGEGARYLGFVNTATDAAGQAVIAATLTPPVPLAAGEYVTATATRTAAPLNTSEFSAAILAYGALVVTTTADTTTGSNTGSISLLIANPGTDGRISLREAILATNNTAGADPIRFGIPLSDANHLYYQNDASAGTLSSVQPTALADAASPSSPAITNFDPDYPTGHTRSWYRISLGPGLPAFTGAVDLDGTTQPFSLVSGGPVIELDASGGSTTTLDLQAGSAGSTIRGLVINRSPPPAGNAILVRTSNNVIAGNYLGTNVAGTAAGPGNGVGVRINGGASAANNNRIGGTTLADRNLLSANALDGIMISGGMGGAANNLVQGNYIGVDVTGTLDLGNGFQGVAVFATSNTNNVIGGTAPGAGNVIAGNGGHGIEIHDPGSTLTLVQGNRIGTNALGTVGIPNGLSGVRFDTGTSGNTVGGTVAAAANLIAFNNSGNTAGRGGITLSAAAGTGNSILGNSIYSNTLLGIDLNEDAVTANDAGDGDSGPNDLLNFPLIASAFESGGTLTVNFRLDAPAGSYRIEMFKNPSGADPSTFGEGQAFANAANVNHPGGNLFYLQTFSGSSGDVITATTTRCTDPPACTAFGSTSEFSKSMAAVTTAVELLSFTAAGREKAVDLAWQTASELGNLGFHLYRSASASGPYVRLTDSLIPGLGSSPIGAAYAYRDQGLTNGVPYFYKLEDVENTGATELHGPVSAVPGTADPGEDGDGGGQEGQDPTPVDPNRVTYGDPSAVSLEVLEHDVRHALLELRTGGFYATRNEDGSVDLEIPTFEDSGRPGQPQVPTRRAWVEAVTGRRVRVTSVQALDVVSYPGLRPAPASAPALDVTPEGTVEPRRRARREEASFRLRPYPRLAARLVGTAFQRETKKAELELAPLRFRPAPDRLVLARRLLVQVEFEGQARDEISLGGSRGRRLPLPRPRSAQAPVVQLVVRDPGLYRVPFEDLFPGRRSGLAPSSLSLARQGEKVAFFVDRSSFGPGASLYFLSEGASLRAEAPEVVYELTLARGGLRMGVASATPSGPATSFYWRRLRLEENKTYQSGLLDAPDLWLWQVLVSPVTRSYPFTVDSLAGTSAPARLTVWLQGASDFEADPDHHVRISVNGTPLAETSFDGQVAKTIEAEITSGLLVEGTNTLEIQNVGDTAAAYSMVLLDKFEVVHPRATVAVGGVLEGSFTESGTVEVAGLGADSLLLDTTEATPRWLTHGSSGPGVLTFRAEVGRRYFAAASSALKAPTLRFPAGNVLRSKRNQADYLLVAPREFLEAADPLLTLRRTQGLRTKAVAIEDVYDAFGSGEASADALKDFLAYAYHSWKRPSPRYVVLLGDATYDPKDYLNTGVKNRIPPLLARTTYLWTASDPAYAAVNGDDLLPDLALGRLSAGTVEEARILVEKVVAFETAGRDLSGPAVLVADNPDLAGNFEANANDLADTVLAGRSVQKVFLSEAGASTRAEIAHTLDQGASLLSYVGHGSIAVWASENVWNNLDLNTLAPQPQQPLLFTMNCLNGFFHFPPLNSLAEQFVKAEGKGAVAALSPSGLSLDAPAHVLHRALLTEILSGRHQRLGDAVLAAQSTYADSGAFPELLTIYHLFGDPAMRIR